jgi:hypothetical protein
MDSFIIPAVNILNVNLGSLNNSVEVQCGDTQAEEVETFGAQWIQQTGFCSLPPNAVAGGAAAEGMLFKDSNRDYLFASRDVASQENYGLLNPGETCIYAAGPDGKSQARILLKADNSINLYTAASAGGSSMGLFINPASDTISLINGKGYGLIISDDGISLTMGGTVCALQLDSSGNISLIGTGQTQIDGSGIVLGSIAVTGVNSALIGPTGLAGVASLKVLIE